MKRTKRVAGRSAFTLAALALAALSAAALSLPAPLHAEEQPQRPKARPAAVLENALEGRMDAPPPSLAPDPAAIDAAIRLAVAPNSTPATAQTAQSTSAANKPIRDPNRGAVTNLPLPRYVSLKTSEGNARRGPGLTHRIDWVFTRAGMPLKLTAEHGHWRRIEDADGLGGWVHYALLSGVRSVIVADELAKFHSRPDSNAQVLFQAERGVVAKIAECKNDWCRVSIEGERGWAPISAFWGIDQGETIE